MEVISGQYLGVLVWVVDEHASPPGYEEGIRGHRLVVRVMDVHGSSFSRGDVENEIDRGVRRHHRGQIPLSVVDEPGQGLWTQNVRLGGL